MMNQSEAFINKKKLMNKKKNILFIIQIKISDAFVTTCMLKINPWFEELYNNTTFVSRTILLFFKIYKPEKLSQVYYDIIKN